MTAVVIPFDRRERMRWARERVDKRTPPPQDDGYAALLRAMQGWWDIWL